MTNDLNINMDTSPVIELSVDDDVLSDALDADDPLVACIADANVEFFTSRLSKVTITTTSKVCKSQPCDIVSNVCTTKVLKICQSKSYNINPCISPKVMSTTIPKKEIEIKSRATGDEVTCINVHELWDMCKILCEILAHYEPSTGELVDNRFGKVEEIIPTLLEGSALS